MAESIFARLRRSRGTICPSEAARDVWPEAWRDHMNDTRAVARRLAAEERLEWLQGGRIVDPATARGPIRLGRGPRFEA